MNLRNAVWAVALALLLVNAGAAQDKDGVKGYEVFSTSTPGGGGTLESQGVNGERTPWFLSHAAPALPGVVNVVVTYYDSPESLDKAKEKEKGKEKKKEAKKPTNKESERPSVPTYDPRFYDYKDGKLVPKAQGSSGATMDSNRETAAVKGLVLFVPDNVHGAQPFSFAVTGGETVPGEVVTLQTAEGTVVQQGAADKDGRVFLEAGLPAGAYLVSLATRDGQPAQPVGQIQIKQRPSDALERPWEHLPQPMQLRNAPRGVKFGDPFSLSGHGFSPNSADMQVSLAGAGGTQEVPVLAATEDQLKLAPATQLRPGLKQLRITNMATGQSTAPVQVLVYDMQGHLERATLTSHDKTRLVVNTQPQDMPLTVRAAVVSGPVDFGAGSRVAEAVTSNGQAVFPVYAERGAGPFQIDWTLAMSAPCTAESACISYQDDQPRFVESNGQSVPNTRGLDAHPEALGDLSDRNLQLLYQDLLWRLGNDTSGRDGAYLSQWRRRVEAELRKRGFEVK